MHPWEEQANYDGERQLDIHVKAELSKIEKSILFWTTGLGQEFLRVPRG